MAKLKDAVFDRGPPYYQAAMLPTPLVERDRRRPCGWDWLLCFIAPLNAISYHHRRAGFTLTHLSILLLVLLFTTYASGLMTFSWLGDLVVKVVEMCKSANDEDGIANKLAALPAERRVQLIQDFFNAGPKTAILSNVGGLGRFLGFAVHGLAFYTVWAAKRATETARRELVEGYLVSGSSAAPSLSMHPVLASPKGTGSAFLSYFIAIFSPSVAYCLNADSRLSAYGISILYGLFYSPFVMSLAASLTINNNAVIISDPELRSLVSTRLMIGAVVALVLAIVFPVRMAVMLVYRSRQRYAKTLTVE